MTQVMLTQVTLHGKPASKRVFAITDDFHLSDIYNEILSLSK